VEKGKLTLDLAYNIVKRKLDSTNTIFFDQFHLGDKVESPTATKLPVNLALSLLRDRHGEIHLDVPVTGSFDDPKFRVLPSSCRCWSISSKGRYLALCVADRRGWRGDELHHVRQWQQPAQGHRVQKAGHFVQGAREPSDNQGSDAGPRRPGGRSPRTVAGGVRQQAQAEKLKELAGKGETMPDTASVQFCRRNMPVTSRRCMRTLRTRAHRAHRRSLRSKRWRAC